MKKEALILSAAILLAQTKAFAQIDLLGVDEENQTVSEEQIVDISEKETQISQDNNTEEQIENQMTEENVIKADNKVQSSPVDDYFAGFIEDVEAEKKAKREAGKMLNERPKIIKLRKSQLKELERNKLEREKLRQKFIAREQEKMKPEEKVQNIMESYENAPLGLYWAITPEKMQQIGFELEQIEREDYPNSYIVKNYESRGTGGYENVIVSFGENNELWCINAQTSAQKDDPTAKETLKLYNKYFEALSEKYGIRTNILCLIHTKKKLLKERAKMPLRAS